MYAGVHVKRIKHAMTAMSLGLIAGASFAATSFDFTCVSGTRGCTMAGASVASWSLTDNVLTIANLDSARNTSYISGISFDARAGQQVSLAPKQMPGVSYAKGNGLSLPSSLAWTADYKFSPRGKASTGGINEGEALSFNLTGVSMVDIQRGDFRFAVLVQGLPGGRSESLINVSQVTEGEPLTMSLAGLAVVGMLGLRRRNRN
jgi:hypothetical protein